MKFDNDLDIKSKYNVAQSWLPMCLHIKFNYSWGIQDILWFFFNLKGGLG